MSVMATGGDPQAEVSVPSTQGGVLHDRLVNLLLANLDAADVAFLTRIAILDPLHPDLCAAVAAGTVTPASGWRGWRAIRPVFAAGEASDWMRMHTLARDELRRRFALLPAGEQARLHARAAEGLAERGLFEAAALHALAAGRREAAYDLAERSLYESLMTRGGQGAVLEWLDRLPADEVDRRPRLLLAAAWSLALSERHDEASRFIDRILAQPERRRRAALRMRADPKRGSRLCRRSRPLRRAARSLGQRRRRCTDPMLLQVHANRSAFRTLLEGEPALARLRQQHAPRGGRGEAQGYLGRWGDFIVGLSYLWEGQVLLAEKLVRPTLARAEGDLGRRNPFTCMLAALLAAAIWERNDSEAGALLANRLDVLERTAFPRPCFSATGRWRASPWPRARRTGRSSCSARWMRSASRAGCRGFASPASASRCACTRAASAPKPAATCAPRSMPSWPAPDAPQGPLWRAQRRAAARSRVRLRRHRRAGVAPCGRHRLRAPMRWRRACKLGRLHIELLGHARVGARPLRREVAAAAARGGRRRRRLRPAARVRRCPSGAGRLGAPGAGGRSAAGAVRPGPPAAPPGSARPAPARATARTVPNMVLTPKEREVLELLERNLSNKEIGLAMQVGEETIKWHMKNLFAKLDAGTRKQVVQRARILGLLETER